MEIRWHARPAEHSSTTQMLQNISRRQKIRNTKSILNASNVDKCFRYLHTYKVLICLEHATGIQNLDSHLRDYHAVPAKERTTIVKKYSWVVIETADQVCLPAPIGQPNQELGHPINGLQCTEPNCDYISVNKGAFRKHGKKEHGLRWIGDTSELYMNVKVQTFFRKGGLQRYFVVHAPDGNDEPSAPAGVQGEVDRLLTKWKETKKSQEEKAQTMDAEAANTDKTDWFKRTGWLEHLVTRNRVHLAHQVRLPDRNELSCSRLRNWWSYLSREA